jgi:hypothetical protein
MGRKPADWLGAGSLLQPDNELWCAEGRHGLTSCPAGRKNEGDLITNGRK